MKADEKDRDASSETPTEDHPEPLSVGQRPSPEPLERGTVLGGRYEVDSPLGKGGAGQVFRAFDRFLKEHVALKVLRPERAADRSWIKRLAREVKIARLIRHRNLCRVYELGHEDGHWFITMELAEGGTLRDLLNDRDRSLGLPEAHAVCAGLATLHALGIAHRDVTPQNILRMSDGRLVISDFGLAVAEGENTTFFGGTPRYMPPEVNVGERADLRSDVYQLGLVLHEIVFGRRPEWDGKLTPKSPLGDAPTAVEEELATLCAACLHPDPMKRPANAGEVAGWLTAAERTRPRGRLAAAWRRVGRVLRHRGAQRAVLTMCVLALGVQAGRVAFRPRPCADAGSRVANLWNGSMRDAARRAFGRSGKSDAMTAFSTVARLLGDHVDKWTAAYTEACQATHVRHVQSEEVLYVRTACLLEDLDSTSALASVLAHADGTVVDHAVEAATHLDDLSRCSDVKRLRASAPPPADPMARAKVKQLQVRLSEANALFEAGQYARSMTSVDEIVREATPIGYCPLLGRALATRANDLFMLGDPHAKDAFEHAAYSAQACGDDVTFASAASGLVIPALTSAAEAEAWFRLGTAALEHAGGDSRIEGWLFTNLSGVRYYEGRYPESLELQEKALAVKTRYGGPRSLDALISRANVGVLLRKLGRADEALAMARVTLADEAQLVGEGHHSSLQELVNIGDYLVDLERPGEARSVFLRALHNEQLADDLIRAAALSGLGRVALAESDPAAARSHLESALPLAEKGNAPPSDLAEMRFALARAIDQSGGDRRRATGLARQALATFEALPGEARAAGSVRAWLKTRSK